MMPDSPNERLRQQQKQQYLGIVRGLLMQMFGRPKGLLGRLGGIILARTKRDFTQWVIPLLEVQPDSKVLEVGFGPGVAIQILATTASTGSVAGVDYSQEMVEQATTRNAKAIAAGIVQLHYGSVENYRLQMTPSIELWRLTPCKFGQMRWLGCGKYGG